MISAKHRKTTKDVCKKLQTSSLNRSNRSNRLNHRCDQIPRRVGALVGMLPTSGTGFFGWHVSSKWLPWRGSASSAAVALKRQPSGSIGHAESDSNLLQRSNLCLQLQAHSARSTGSSRLEGPAHGPSGSKRDLALGHSGARIPKIPIEPKEAIWS